MFKYTFDLLKNTSPEAWEKLSQEWEAEYNNVRSLKAAASIKAKHPEQMSTLQFQFYSDFLRREGAGFGPYTPEGHAEDMRRTKERVPAYEVVLEFIRNAGRPVRMVEIQKGLPKGGEIAMNYNSVNSALQLLVRKQLVRKVDFYYQPTEIGHSAIAHKIRLLNNDFSKLIQDGVKFKEYGKRPYALRATLEGIDVGIIEYKGEAD